VRDAWRAAADTASLARIVAIPLVLALLAFPVPEARLGAAGLFFAAALTDAADGWLARHGRRHSYGPGGALLDLTADKLLVAVVLIDLTSRQLAPAWVVAVIVARELAVGGVRAYAGLHGVLVRAGGLGKLKMAVSSLAIPAAILSLPVAPLLLSLAAGVTVVSAWPYVSAWTLLLGRNEAEAADRRKSGPATSGRATGL
jgi:CDP-diacylglycerol--glycerol-3-phosphate 3-phosphatidyltransferase